jgi:pSer/pThr/pTyr-binding forkhead associated (FHA) protein
VISCDKCGKENQDHYKFCLGCGAELSRKDVPKAFSAATPPHGMPAAQQAPAVAPVAYAPPAASPPAASPYGAPPQMMAPAAMPQPVPAAMQTALAQPPMPAPAPMAAPAPTAPAAQPPRPSAAAAATVDCPQCGQSNPRGNRFCAACGYNLSALQMAAAPAPVAASAPAAAAPGLFPVSLTALRADGSEAGRYDLPSAPSVTVGRDTGSVFAGDSYLSPRHATLTRRGSDLFVKDEGSLNGVYVKLKPNEPWRLAYGEVFRIGQEIIRLEELKGQGLTPDGVQRFGSPARGFIGRICLVIGRDTTGNSFPVPEQGVHLGRERGDVLFSEDGYVSGLHCRITRGDDGHIYLTDVGSSNGTFGRLMKEHQVHSGDILLMGQQLFRVDY